MMVLERARSCRSALEALRYWTRGTGLPLVSASAMRESRWTGKRNSVWNQASQVPFAGTMLLPQLHAEGPKVGESQNGRSAAPSGTLVAGSEDEERGRQRYLCPAPIIPQSSGPFPHKTLRSVAIPYGIAT